MINLNDGALSGADLRGLDAVGDRVLTDLLRALELGFALEEYLDGVARGEVCMDELELVAALGLDRSLYLCDRRAGVSHGDVLDAYELRVGVMAYHWARQVGCTRDELCLAVQAGLSLSDMPWPESRALAMNRR